MRENTVSDIYSISLVSSSYSHTYSVEAISTISDDSHTIYSELSGLTSEQEAHLTSSPVKDVGEPAQVLAESHIPHSSSTISGCKFVIDIIDSTVRPRYMREDAQNQSLHYVQVYAVKDRIDFAVFPDTTPSSVKNIDIILPTSDEYQTLKENMAILVAHILIDHIPFFSEDYKGLVTRHIKKW